MPTFTWNEKRLPTIGEIQPKSYEQWNDENQPHVLHCGDNLSWLAYAKAQGKRFDLIYLDPPFCSQANYTQQIKTATTTHVIDGFTDKFSVDEYLQFIYERILLLKDVLTPNGSLFLHCDYQQSHNIRCILDEVFGPEQFRNEIIWHYTGGGRATKYFSRKHDSIFWYSHSSTWTFNTDSIRIPYKDTSGFAKGGITSKSGKKYLPNPKGTLPDDTWDIPMLNPLAKERTGYPTQKPLPLLERIILACSNEGDRILDPFMGSGTTGIAAIKHRRHFTGLDKNWNSIHLMRQRLSTTKATFSISCEDFPESGIQQIRLYKSDTTWKVQSLTDIPIQMVYGRTDDGKWCPIGDLEHHKHFRVVDIHGKVSDFICAEYPNSSIILKAVGAN